MKYKTKNTFNEREVFNYCVSFVDLLGQGLILKDQNLLPKKESRDEWEKVYTVIRESLYPIFTLQRQSEEFLQNIKKPNPLPSFRKTLAEDLQISWDEANITDIKTHRWSDGLMLFACLNKSKTKCYINGVHGLFLSTGLLCLRGLATGHPIRGGIECAWGVELEPNELYGPAVARAYDLENTQAKHSRIIVGPNTIEILKIHQSDLSQDAHAQCNQALSDMSLNMLIKDTDDHWILHYLGKEFQREVDAKIFTNLYTNALKFVSEQLIQHKNNGDDNLVCRYERLLEYFKNYPINN